MRHLKMAERVQMHFSENTEYVAYLNKWTTWLKKNANQ